ncbi:P-loop containing nucleoside triphosphate hydrolase protein [Auriculariales sp. MPI-PUGE-AT-0066]|nr:P-loop containing nucleoside triphosphate hydrolase protein [Auriculariales sp. MPI-PUGE-AT-0066]
MAQATAIALPNLALNGEAVPVKHLPALNGDTPLANGVSHDLETDVEVKEAEVKEVAPPVPMGSLLEYKRVDYLYDTDDREWVLRDSAPVKDSTLEDRYRGFSFTVVRTLAKRTYDVQSIEIELKNIDLKAACQHVIQEFDGISWNSRVLRIDTKVFIAFFPELEAYQKALASKADCDKTDEDIARAQHLKLLLEFFRHEHGAQIAELESLRQHGEITFDLMWAIMRPRTLIFLRHDPVTGEPRAMHLVKAELSVPFGEPPQWSLTVEYIDATGNGARYASTGQMDGPRFGLSTKQIKIYRFNGTQKITSLRAFPMVYHPRKEEMRTKLIERGKRWRDLDGIHNRFYDSVAFCVRKCCYVRVTVNSRIMIDIGSFKKINPNYPLPSVKGSGDDENLHSDEDVDANSREIELTDEQLLVASPIIYGFSLSDKLWLEFNVEHVKTFTWNDEAFERLVLPPAQKNLIRSLVDSHRNESIKFDDFVEGKGQGLILNLHGKPGIGKTLSAEATSEHVRRPLYVVGAGDLGEDAATLDASLNEIFSVAAAWKAIVLIDEADVFLEQRSLHDLHRNAVVAVFLRQLEYFRGILFLTTNRVQSFDEAFQSRIHVSIRYRELNVSTRLSIWNTFLERVHMDPSALTEEQSSILGNKDLNGRQIKNAARTASAVAASRGEPVDFAHIMEVLGVMDQFEEDSQEIAASH